jgi:hypothetical protein
MTRLSPDDCAKRARMVIGRVPLSKYREAIVILRSEKGFSYREIARWLSERGIPCDYNEVYRVFGSQ